MSRDETVRFYTSEETKQWLKREAETREKSLSECCHQVVTEYIDREEDRRQYSRYGVDQQIEIVLTEIREEASTILTEFQSETGVALERLQRLRTVYVIALWRLLKEEYPSAQRKAAMKHAVDHVGLDPCDDPNIEPVLSTATDQSSPSISDSAGNAPSHTQGEDDE